MCIKESKCMFKYIKTIRRRISIGYDEFCASKSYYHSSDGCVCIDGVWYAPGHFWG